ncbi:biotin transporter BioY [Microbacterium sp. LRZ72]|nr:biotin transporter BioY [Microbacterium sp. LRZ72]
MSLTTPVSRLVLADLIGRSSIRARALTVDAGLVIAGVALVALLAKVSFFIGPVPITGQTLGVIAVGAALGSRRGAAALTTYMLAGLAGMPVFAGAIAGPAYVLSPSFGFVVGFIPAAFVAGWFAERAWDRKPWLAFFGFAAASTVPFLIGIPYMSLILATVSGQQVTVGSVLEMGLWPFIAPGLIKAGAAALVIPGAWLLVRAVDRSKRH